MEYNISGIANLLGVTNLNHPELPVSQLLTDSRDLTYPLETLFFAITTTTGDGHRYISDLHAKGVRNFVVSRIPAEAEAFSDANFIVVKDPLAALQAIAAHHRSQFEAPVIAITGSRGKTIVKEWLNQLLRHEYTIVRSPRSYNSQIGVPLSVWQFDDDTNLAIFEAGISRPGEMAKLQRIIRPTIGIFTNIGVAHSDGFGSVEEKVAEKSALLRDCECVIYNGDDHLLSENINNSGVEIAWSMTDSDRPLYISSMENSGNGSTVVAYSYLHAPLRRITVPFTSHADLENVVHCLAVMLYLGIDADEISDRISRLTHVGTRLEVIEGVGNSMLIHDNYTSDYNSLMPALNFMNRRLTADLTSTVILSDLMHDASEPSRLYCDVAELLRRKGVSKVIGIGPEISRHSGFFDENARFFATTDEFMAEMSPADFKSSLVLIKGAPQFRFERIGEMLEARQHETVLEINLDAMVDNFNAFRSRLRPTTGMVCMIKASGYGAGSHELAKTLQSQGATYLAVAVHDEGADLRQAGITMPIIVLNPTVENFKSIFTNRLEPEIYSLDFLRELIKEAEHYGITDYPVHIKIDSGMHRLGFRKENMQDLIDILSGQNRVVPKSIFSHLCAADDPLEDDYTMQQFAYFGECFDMLQKAFPERRILRHILNSTGITRFPEYQFDMVRLGIGLYGIKTMHDGSQDDLRPVSSLHTVIISVKKWEAGITIGYNRRGVLKRESVIATIPIGYADGINRHLGYGNASMVVRGAKCPTVGSICMDACMIDVTDVPDVRVGDRVEVFGENMPVDVLAETLETIPYEVLTSISQRVKRIYYRE
ncbi:MAG: bifunctional UDP-N-acetylmuramoyl-tripeptide:D-alanyl-D-alanine ligase/alanine racemase [Duncaniella sp.]|nr:bifunctional UDP-N-acetylmuramoyl-tripeptide:D-alanyl-D-alanine ligase/alanine racemase [Duncaniella sp.]